MVKEKKESKHEEFGDSVKTAEKLVVYSWRLTAGEVFQVLF